MDTTDFVQVVLTIVGLYLTFWSTRHFTRHGLEREVRSLERELEDVRESKRVADSAQLAAAARFDEAARAQAALLASNAEMKRRLEDIRMRLQTMEVVRTYRFPVVLVGPRGVGKTSLLLHWSAPWRPDHPESTATMRFADVPFHDYAEPEPRAHAAMKEVKVRARIHLVLRVHDFPGEKIAQHSIRDTVIEEGRALQQTGRNLGVVVICMFDAEQASIGLLPETEDYYSSGLFEELRDLVTDRKIPLERVICVFNRFDLLRKRYPDAGMTDDVLMAKCRQQYGHILQVIESIAPHHKPCVLPTVLARHTTPHSSDGAIAIKGEATRGYVDAFDRKPEAAVGV